MTRPIFQVRSARMRLAGVRCFFSGHRWRSAGTPVDVALIERHNFPDQCMRCGKLRAEAK